MKEFVPYILSWFAWNDRLDIFWDIYSTTSLKSGTREQRGSGAQRRVTFSTKVPRNRVLSVSAFIALSHQLEQLWVTFGTQRRYRYIPIHVIAEQLWPSKTAAMSDFHALTGCDTISSFFGKGKKTARTCWQSLPDLTVALQALVHPKPCFQTLKIHLPLLEQFVTQLYGVSEMIPQLLMLQGTISSVIKANHFFKCPLVATPFINICFE